MSDFGYEDGPHRYGSRRSRHREPEHVQETTYVERSSGPPVRDIVYRDREDSIENIKRDFPTPGAEYRKSRYRATHAPRRVRSAGRRDYDGYSDYSHERHSRRRSQYRDDRDGHYYSDDYDRTRRHRRKSIGESLKDLGDGLGLGEVISAVAGRSRSSSRGRHHHDGYHRHSHSRSRSRSRPSRKWEQAAKAAVVAGAVEAFKSRKDPGPWTGEKGQRVATAALGAAGIGTLIGKDSDRKENRHIAESAIGGLLANRFANGPRSRSSSRDGRSRSRSRSRSGARSRSRSLFGHSRSRSRGRDGAGSTLRDVAGAGAVLAAGKALYNRMRSKSKSRHERSRSVSSEDSHVPSRSRHYDEGRSVEAGSNKKRNGSSSSESTTDMKRESRRMRGKEFLTGGLAAIATIHAASGIYSSIVASKQRRRLVSEGEMPLEARKRKSKNLLQDVAALGIAALGIKSVYSEWKGMSEQRHSVQELESKHRKRRKQREQREREARQASLINMNG